MDRVLISVLSATTIAIGVGGTIAGYPITWAAAGVLLVLLVAHAMFDRLAALNARRAHGDVRRQVVPATHIEHDDLTPLGDTDQVHDELRSVDVPTSNPAHRELADREGRRRRRAD